MKRKEIEINILDCMIKIIKMGKAETVEEIINKISVSLKDSPRVLEQIKRLYQIEIDKPKYIVYGDYNEELQDISFRSDLKILGMYEEENMENAIKKVIENCHLEDIDTIENQEVTIIEVKNFTEKSISLDEVIYIQNLQGKELKNFLKQVTY